MEEKIVSQYKVELERERTRLLDRVKSSEKPPDFGDKEKPDTDEEADESEEFGNQLAMARDLKNRLDEIDVALAKIKTGKFGICENCGQEIEMEILKIDSSSRLCKNCKLHQ